MSDPHPRFRLAGAVVQGLALGVALIVAVMKLIQLASQSSVFRYEGF